MQGEDRQTFLSFCSGGNYYVIPIKEVVYITESSALKMRTVPKGDGSTNRVFEFNGQPSQLISLSQVFNIDSRAEESQKLIELLNARKQDHISWMEALETSLKNDVPFEKATDPHKCAFGMWYDSYETNDADLSNILAKFDAPHKRIHALAEKLLAKAAEGEEQRNEALRILKDERSLTLQGLLQLFAQAVGRLDDMAKPITIIVSKGGRHRFGVEVDIIGDVIDFQTNEWMSASSQTAGDSQCFDGFYQGEEQLFINFDLEALAIHLQAPA
jgi:chemotaxis signal transduction protein